MYLLYSFFAVAIFAQGRRGNSGPQRGRRRGLETACDEKERESPLDVFFLVDGSNSIGGLTLDPSEQDPSAWPGQLRFIKQLLTHTMTEQDRVGIFQFSLPTGAAFDANNVGTLEFPLGTPIDEIVDNVMGMQQRGGATPTKQAIDVVVEKFKAAPVVDFLRDRLLVIITDGDPTCSGSGNLANWCSNTCHDKQGNVITETQDKLDDEDIRTVIIGVNNEAPKLDCLVEDPEVNIVKISDFHSFEEYRDPTGDENLLCVDPTEFELKCCQIAKIYVDVVNGHDQLINQQKERCGSYNRDTCIQYQPNNCVWGIDYDQNVIEGCGVTPAPTVPTAVFTELDCKPLDNCVVKGGEKVFGWVNVGGRVKASSACACAEKCEQEGGSEAKWHVKRKVCKCWKQSTHIELQSEPFEPNAKHGGNAGGKTQCVQMSSSVAELTEEKIVTRAPSTVPAIPSIPPAPGATTAKPTAKPTWDAVEWAEECAERKEAFDANEDMQSFCTWNPTTCKPNCA